ncbi:MAG: YidB family protein [Burkholderiales bacterium]
MAIFDHRTSEFSDVRIPADTQVLNNVLRIIGETGGLAGLVLKFKDNGLGAIAESWVGTGGNLPVSAEQIQDALGYAEVERQAERAGIPGDEFAAQLARLLPSIVDRLTPDGVIPAARV